MMLYPAMNKLTGYIPNRYMLVDVVARRARQIADEAEETGEHLTEKPVTLAIQEVADGKLDARNMDLTLRNRRIYSRRRKRHSNNRRGEAWKPLRS